MSRKITLIFDEIVISMTYGYRWKYVYTIAQEQINDSLCLSLSLLLPLMLAVE